MKQKLLLLIIFLISSIAVMAQIGKGQHYIGGSLSYNYDSYGSSSTYNFNTGYTIYANKNISTFAINPQVGFFISDKWSIGIQPIYSRTSGTASSSFYSYSTPANNYVSSDNYHTSVLGLGINLRYYYMITDKVGFFPEFGLSSINNLTYFKYGTLTLGGSPNIVFFPTPKIGVNLGFGKIAYSFDYQAKTSIFNLGLNNNIAFGLNYYWGRK
ncbi:hypothetical protein BH09BAC6_BH09BAC6_18880 [soil metagenome]